MKISFIDFIKSAFVNRDEKFRQKLSIFLICLLISVIIWFTIKLSDEYDTIIEIPLTFTHIPKNKVLTYISDSVLQVEILEKGSDLIRMMYVETPDPVNISLRFLPVYPKGGAYHGMITTSALINDIEREHNLLGKIVSISPDTIYLTFEPEKSRKLPVSANFDMTFEKQYMRYGNIGFTPDSVTVKGPQVLIEALDSISLGDIKLEQLNKNYNGEQRFPADSINRLLTINPNVVSYNVPVEKFTEAEMEVPVKLINSRDLKVKIFPEKVKVLYMVALKDYQKVEPGMIDAVADMTTINHSDDGKIRVGIQSYPPYIRINSLQPDRVEFIIIK